MQTIDPGNSYEVDRAYFISKKKTENGSEGETLSLALIFRIIPDRNLPFQLSYEIGLLPGEKECLIPNNDIYIAGSKTGPLFWLPYTQRSLWHLQVLAMHSCIRFYLFMVNVWECP